MDNRLGEEGIKRLIKIKEFRLSGANAAELYGILLQQQIVNQAIISAISSLPINNKELLRNLEIAKSTQDTLNGDTSSFFLTLSTVDGEGIDE